MRNPLRYFRDRFSRNSKAAERFAAPKTWMEARRMALDIIAKYESAQDTSENVRRWANADAMSANAANDPGTLRKMRMRGRFERSNNSYARGTVASASNDLVGTGPRVQLDIPGVGSDVTRKIERQFMAWALEDAVDLPDKLRVLDGSTYTDGDCFGLMITNRANRHPVKPNIRLIEADQCTTPNLTLGNATQVDGIVRDQSGNAIEYHFLKDHPGDTTRLFGTEYDRVDAKRVIHWFTPERPGQARGVPELQAALPLFAQLRRYTLATLGAAELAACLAGVMRTQTRPEDGGAVDIKAMEEIEIVRNALLTLPQGWTVEQMKPEQPTTTYPDFKREILNEIGRCLNMPLNVVSGNSSGYNFSSGRLDFIPYHRGVWIRRQRMEARALNPLFREWIDEAALTETEDGKSVIPPGLPPIETWTITWGWDGFDSLDPDTQAKTDKQELESNTVTFAEICARKGTNWREVLKQRAIESEFAATLGLGGVTADAAGTGGDVQTTALNGAQVTSLIEICNQLVGGQITGPAADAIIRGAFPGLDPSLVKIIVEELDGHEAPAPAAAPAAKTAPVGKEAANAA